MVLVFAVPGMVINLIPVLDCVYADVANLPSLFHMLP